MYKGHDRGLGGLVEAEGLEHLKGRDEQTTKDIIADRDGWSCSP